MAKKIKLSLEDLKVQSFVTTLSNAEKSALRGGERLILNPGELDPGGIGGPGDPQASLECTTMSGSDCETGF